MWLQRRHALLPPTFAFIMALPRHGGWRLERRCLARPDARPGTPPRRRCSPVPQAGSPLWPAGSCHPGQPLRAASRAGAQAWSRPERRDLRVSQGDQQFSKPLCGPTPSTAARGPPRIRCVISRAGLHHEARRWRVVAGTTERPGRAGPAPTAAATCSSAASTGTRSSPSSAASMATTHWSPSTSPSRASSWARRPTASAAPRGVRPDGYL